MKYLAIVLNERPLELKCPFCGWTWKPRVAQPRACPYCAHILWKLEKLPEAKTLELEKHFVCEDCHCTDSYAILQVNGRNLCKTCAVRQLTSMGFSEDSMVRERKESKLVDSSTVLTKARERRVSEETRESSIDEEGSFDRPRERGGLSRRKDTSTS